MFVFVFIVLGGYMIIVKMGVVGVDLLVYVVSCLGVIMSGCLGVVDVVIGSGDEMLIF